MFLARVTGHVVATQKDKTLNGQKLFVVEPLNVRYDEASGKPASLGNTGRAIVALDTVGQIEAHLVSRQYEGFVKGTRIRGRIGR